MISRDNANTVDERMTTRNYESALNENTKWRRGAFGVPFQALIEASPAKILNLTENLSSTGYILGYLTFTGKKSFLCF